MTADQPTVGDLAASCGVGFGTSGVRGKVVNFSPAVCHAYIQAFLTLAEPQGRRLLIGQDLRPSSPVIAALCRQSALHSGWTVIDAGVVPTPALAFAAQELGIPAVMVTGSHIPFDRNGLKFYHAQGEITKQDEQGILGCPLPAGLPESNGERPEVDSGILALYRRRYLDFFPAGALAGLRIGVFEHSSVARDVFHDILQALGAETVGLGRSEGFVAVDTEAVRREDIEAAPIWARLHRLDAIVTADGDADRPLVADERGRWIRGDVLGLLCAREVGAASVVTPISSNTALEASGLFGAISRTRIGSPHVLAAMTACVKHPVVGYEANGGFLLGSDLRRGDMLLRALKTRDAMLPILTVLTAARATGRSLSGLLAALPARHTASDRLQDIDVDLCRGMLTELGDDEAALSVLLAPASGAVVKIDHTDGLRVVFANGDIVHLRLSGNAPEMRCYAESTSVEAAESLCSACLGRVNDRLARA